MVWRLECVTLMRNHIDHKIILCTKEQGPSAISKLNGQCLHTLCELRCSSDFGFWILRAIYLASPIYLDG